MDQGNSTTFTPNTLVDKLENYCFFTIRFSAFNGQCEWISHLFEAALFRILLRMCIKMIVMRLCSLRCYASRPACHLGCFDPCYGFFERIRKMDSWLKGFRLKANPRALHMRIGCLHLNTDHCHGIRWGINFFTHFTFYIR